MRIVRPLLVYDRCNAREAPGVLAALAQTLQRWRDALASVVLPLEAQLALLQCRRSTSPVPSNIAFAVWRLAPSPSQIVAQPPVSSRGAARLSIFQACTARTAAAQPRSLRRTAPGRGLTSKKTGKPGTRAQRRRLPRSSLHRDKLPPLSLPSRAKRLRLHVPRSSPHGPIEVADQLTLLSSTCVGEPRMLAAQKAETEHKSHTISLAYIGRAEA